MKAFSLKHFVIMVLLLLPLSFTLWYFTAPWHLAPLTWLSQTILKQVLPNAIQWLGLEGHTLVLASSFAADAQQLDSLGFHLNPLAYSYSFPLLAALLLATPSRQHGLTLLIGLLALLPFQLLAMLSSVVKTLAFEIGLPFQERYGFSGWGLDALALFYQISTLILPMVLPLIIWGWLNRSLLEKLMPPVRIVANG
ncbi:exosortase H-associated membrane protein [Thiolinea disciformis]|uniref:exosortase H-associated membrane protein n=1 Tax=Thiolinea disciformis TaxID=125614 RepID=UPI00036E6261|nr:exosortase H-associated membrane protein [Thiolinea disciformis]